MRKFPEAFLIFPTRFNQNDKRMKVKWGVKCRAIEYIQIGFKKKKISKGKQAGTRNITYFNCFFANYYKWERNQEVSCCVTNCEIWAINLYVIVGAQKKGLKPKLTAKIYLNPPFRIHEHTERRDLPFCVEFLDSWLWRDILQTFFLSCNVVNNTRTWQNEKFYLNRAFQKLQNQIIHRVQGGESHRSWI